jgi:hypothetical protein
MNMASPWRGLNLLPSGATTADERAAIMFLYAIVGGAPPAAVGNGRFFMLFWS